MNYFSLNVDGTVLKCFTLELSPVEVKFIEIILSYENKITQLNFIFKQMHAGIGKMIKDIIQMKHSKINHITFLSEPLSFDYILLSKKHMRVPLIDMIRQVLNIVSRNTQSKPSYKIFSNISSSFTSKKNLLPIENSNLIIAHTAAQILTSSKLMSITNILNTTTPTVISGITIGIKSKDSIFSCLSLPFSNIDSVSLSILLNGIRHSHTLRSMDLSSNRIGDRGAEMLASELYLNTILTSLNISKNHISGDGLVHIFKSLHVNACLECLYVGMNTIDDRCGEVISEVLTQTDTLTTLSLHKSVSVSSVMETIMDGISKSTSLIDIDISANQISRKVIETLSSILRLQQPPLANINLSKLKLCNTCIEMLFDAMTGNQIVEQIYLASNNITTVGANRILQFILINSSIYFLDLINNEINYHYLHRIEYSVIRNHQNRYLKHLNLFTLLLNKLT